MSRFAARAEERLRAARASQAAILATVGTVVIIRLVLYGLSVAFVIQGNDDLYQMTQVVGSAFGAVLDLLLLLLVWMLFTTLGRVEQEADRVQAFMDNVYRKLFER